MRCINYLSEYLVPVVLFYIVGFAVLQKRPVFDDFIEGALAGLKTVAGILPTLVGLMAAVGVLRTSGFLDFLSGVLAGPAAFLHIPAQVVPLLLVRLVSSSAATGLLLDIFNIGNENYTPRLLPTLTQYTLVCNTNDPKIGGEMAEIFSYPLQVTTSLQAGHCASCPPCDFE